MRRAILPIFRRDGEWYIDCSELSGDDCPEWGPYATKDDAEDDRRPSFIRRIEEMRKENAKARRKVKRAEKCEKPT